MRSKPDTANTNGDVIEVDYFEVRNEAAEVLIEFSNLFDFRCEFLEDVASSPGRRLTASRARVEQAFRALEGLKPLREPENYEGKESEEENNATHRMLAKFADLDRRQRELKAELKDIEAAKVRLVGDKDNPDGPLIEAWRQLSATSMSILGRTFYLHTERRLVRNPEVPPKEAITALKRARLGALVSAQANSNTLMSWLKEQESLKGKGKALGKGMAKCWNVMERTSMRSRKKG